MKAHTVEDIPSATWLMLTMKRNWKNCLPAFTCIAAVEANSASHSPSIDLSRAATVASSETKLFMLSAYKK